MRTLHHKYQNPQNRTQWSVLSSDFIVSVTAAHHLGIIGSSPSQTTLQQQQLWSFAPMQKHAIAGACHDKHEQ
jgi:hypothetical protein